MDCLFNTQIPKSSDKKIILRPTSKTFISGLASSYDTNFPEQLKGYISVYLILNIFLWGLGIGDWAQSPIPNPQSPIPNPQSPFSEQIFKNIKNIIQL
jgi:hypothetical protein